MRESVMKSDLVDVMVKIHHETDLAVLVSDDGGRTRVWLPKSAIEIDRRLEGYAEITLPEKLAYQKALI